MKGQLKRLMAMVLAVSMTVTMLPYNGFAEGAVSDESAVSDTTEQVTPVTDPQPTPTPTVQPDEENTEEHPLTPAVTPRPTVEPQPTATPTPAPTDGSTPEYSATPKPEVSTEPTIAPTTGGNAGEESPEYPETTPSVTPDCKHTDVTVLEISDKSHNVQCLLCGEVFSENHYGGYGEGDDDFCDRCGDYYRDEGTLMTQDDLQSYIVNSGDDSIHLHPDYLITLDRDFAVPDNILVVFNGGLEVAEGVTVTLGNGAQVILNLTNKADYIFTSRGRIVMGTDSVFTIRSATDDTTLATIDNSAQGTVRIVTQALSFDEVSGIISNYQEYMNNGCVINDYRIENCGDIVFNEAFTLPENITYISEYYNLTINDTFTLDGTVVLYGKLISNGADITGGGQLLIEGNRQSSFEADTIEYLKSQVTGIDIEDKFDIVHIDGAHGGDFNIAGHYWCLTPKAQDEEITVIAQGTFDGYESLGEDFKWTLESDGYLYIEPISGYYRMPEFGENGMVLQRPWEDYKEQIKYVNLDYRITQLGSNTFDGCTNLESVSLPQNLEVIGRWVFNDCINLKEVWIHSEWDTATGIYGYSTTDEPILVFAGSGLEKVEIEYGATRVPEAMFTGCRSLYDINLPDTVTHIGANAFESCSMDTFVIPKDIQYIGAGALNDCSVLKELVVSSDLSSCQIDPTAFSNAICLDTLRFAHGVNVINEANVKNLGFADFTTVKLPVSVTTIGANAFTSLTKLSAVRIFRNVTSIDQSAFNLPTTMEIQGHSGSYAETFAAENNIKFVAIDAETCEHTVETVLEMSNRYHKFICGGCGETVQAEHYGQPEDEEPEAICEACGIYYDLENMIETLDELEAFIAAYPYERYIDLITENAFVIDKDYALPDNVILGVLMHGFTVNEGVTFTLGAGSELELGEFVGASTSHETFVFDNCGAIVMGENSKLNLYRLPGFESLDNIDNTAGGKITVENKAANEDALASVISEYQLYMNRGCAINDYLISQGDVSGYSYDPTMYITKDITLPEGIRFEEYDLVLSGGTFTNNGEILVHGQMTMQDNGAYAGRGAIVFDCNYYGMSFEEENLDFLKSKLSGFDLENLFNIEHIPEYYYSDEYGGHHWLLTVKSAECEHTLDEPLAVSIRYHSFICALCGKTVVDRHHGQPEEGEVEAQCEVCGEYFELVSMIDTLDDLETFMTAYPNQKRIHLDNEAPFVVDRDFTLPANTTLAVQLYGFTVNEGVTLTLGAGSKMDLGAFIGGRPEPYRFENFGRIVMGEDSMVVIYNQPGDESLDNIDNTVGAAVKLHQKAANEDMLAELIADYQAYMNRGCVINDYYISEGAEDGYDYEANFIITKDITLPEGIRFEARRLDLNGGTFTNNSEVLVSENLTVAESGAYAGSGNIAFDCDTDLEAPTFEEETIENLRARISGLDFENRFNVEHIPTPYYGKYSGHHWLLKAKAQSETEVTEGTFSGMDSTTEDFRWTLDSDGNFAIEVLGTVTQMQEYVVTGTEVPWAEHQLLIKTVFLPKELTYVGSCTFTGCANLKKVIYEDGSATAFKAAFVRCGNLTEFVLPDSITRIEESAFESTGITSFTVPESLEYIGNAAFYDCQNLAEFVITKDLSGCEIDANAFEGITTIDTLAFDNGVKAITAQSVNALGFTGFTSVKVPNNVRTIGENAFASFNNLGNIRILIGTKYIAPNAFVLSTDMIIHGFTGSYAQRYAEDNGITFMAIDGVVQLTPPQTHITRPTYDNQGSSVQSSVVNGNSTVFKLDGGTHITQPTYSADSKETAETAVEASGVSLAAERMWANIFARLYRQPLASAKAQPWNSSPIYIGVLGAAFRQAGLGLPIVLFEYLTRIVWGK